MKIALSILLGLSVLLNIVLGGYLGYRYFFEREQQSKREQRLERELKSERERQSELERQLERERESGRGRRTFYGGHVLSDDQFMKMSIREKYDTEVLTILQDYHRFIKRVKGKKLIIVEE